MKHDDTKDPNSATNRVARVHRRFKAAEQLDEPKRLQETHAAGEEALEIAEHLAGDLEEIHERIGKEDRDVDGVGPVTAVCGLILDFRDLKAKCDTQEFQRGKLEARNDELEKVGAEMADDLDRIRAERDHHRRCEAALRSRVDDLQAENENLSKLVGELGRSSFEGDDLAGLENAVAEIESDREAYREWTAERAELEERLAAMVVALRMQNKTAESYKRAADRHLRQASSFSNLVHETLDFWRLERKDDGKSFENEEIERLVEKAGEISKMNQPDQTLGEFMLGQWKDEEKRADELEAEKAELENLLAMYQASAKPKFEIVQKRDGEPAKVYQATDVTFLAGPRDLLERIDEIEKKNAEERREFGKRERMLEQVIEPICEAVGFTNYEEARDFVLEMASFVDRQVDGLLPLHDDRDVVDFDELESAIDANAELVRTSERIVGDDYLHESAGEVDLVGRVRCLKMNDDEKAKTLDGLAEMLSGYIGEEIRRSSVYAQTANLIRRTEELDNTLEAIRDDLARVGIRPEVGALDEGVEQLVAELKDEGETRRKCATEAKELREKLANWRRERQHIEKRLDAELAKIKERNDTIPETPTLERKLDLFANVHTTTQINRIAAEGRLGKVRETLREVGISARGDEHIPNGVGQLVEQYQKTEKQRNELAAQLEAVEEAIEAAGLRSHEAHENDEPAELVELLHKQRDEMEESRNGFVEKFNGLGELLKKRDEQIEQVIEELHETGLAESDYTDKRHTFSTWSEVRRDVIDITFDRPGDAVDDVLERLSYEPTLDVSGDGPNSLIRALSKYGEGGDRG